MIAIKFTKDHEWVRLEGNDVVVVGITDFAQDQLGDVVHVELPKLHQEISQNTEVSTVDSVKAASDIKSPVSGKVVEINEQLLKDPSLVNKDPVGAGWFYKVQLSNLAELDELMDETAYQALLSN